MKFFRKLKSKFRRRRHVDEYDRSSRGRSPFKIVLDILLFPIHVIFLPFKSLGLFHDKGIDVDEYDKQISLKRRLQKALKWIVRLPLLLVSAPFKLIGSLRKAKRLDALFVLPALVVIGFFAFVFFQVFARGDRIENRYRRGAQKAWQQGDFELAKTYFKRTLAEGKLESPEKFQWAFVLAQTGETQRAQQLFDELAPNDDVGYRPAHRLKAIAIAQQLEKDKLDKVKSSVDKKMLLRHLLNSKDPSQSVRDTEILKAWLAYYLAMEQPKKAIETLEEMAAANPSAYFLISEIYREQGKAEESGEALKKAEVVLRGLLDQDENKHSSQVRFALATALFRQKKYVEAEELLKQGLRQENRDPEIKRSMSEFYVMRHDVALNEGEDSSTLMHWLSQALEADPNYIVIYQRLANMFEEARNSPEITASAKQAFLDNVTGDNPTSMAHFGLSTILLEENQQDKAKFHLEQAYKLDEKVVVVLNNLAWLLAHNEDNPDLDRALELSKTAVEQVPDNGPFRDTLGTIYLKMERYKDAISEFQLALKYSPTDKENGIKDKNAVREKLAVCYKELGMDELEELTRKQITDEN